MSDIVKINLLDRDDRRLVVELREFVWNHVFQFCDSRERIAGEEAGEIAQAATNAAQDAILKILTEDL